MTKYANLVGFGFLSWLLPFLLAIPFYSQEGVPLYDIFLIKSILLGGVRLPIDWALDAVILLPLSGMDAGTYLGKIGLRYLTIPIIAVGIGYAAEQAVRGATVRRTGA